MNDAQHAAYSAYLRGLATMLLLGDWEIELLRTPASIDAFASVTLHKQKDRATVSLDAGFWHRTLEERRLTLTHELLHAHTARLCRVMTRLNEMATTELVRYVDREFDEEEEILIHTLARILAPTLPLPPEVS